MGYITPSKPVGRLMLNFIRSPHGGQRGGDRCGIVHAADDHLVEPDRTILLEPGPHLGRRAAGGVAAHDVVAHQPIDLAPVLRGIGRRQRRLVERCARQPDVLGVMGAAQHEADRPADRVDASFSVAPSRV